MIRGFAVFIIATGRCIWISPPWPRPEDVLPYVRWRNRVTIEGEVSIPWETTEPKELA